MRTAKIYILFCCMLCLTGCWDNKNIPDLLYVTSLGLDYKENQYEAYFQIVSFNHVAKSENARGGGGPQVYIGKGKGKTPSLALTNIYETAQRRVNWSHVRAVLLTENALQAGGEEYFDILKRYREFRYSPWVFGTKGSIEDIFKTSSFFDMSPITTILGTPEENYLQSSFISPLQAQEYQMYINEPGDTSLIPTLAIDTTTWKAEENSSPKLKINGVFALQKDNFHGWMPNQKLNGLRWMNKNTSRTAVETKAGIVSLEKPKPHISVDTDTEGHTIFNITVKVQGNIVELQDGSKSEQEIEKETEEKIKGEIRSTYENGLQIGADVYRFRHILFKKRYKNWSNIELTASSLDQIDVQVHIQHTGKLQKKV